MITQNLTDNELREKGHFNKMAKSYDKVYGYDSAFTIYKIGKKAKFFAKLARKFSKTPNPTFLELGCGTGEYTKQIAALMPKAQIVGLDISEEIIGVAKEKCSKDKNVSFRVESAYDTGFKKKQFDIIYGFYVLHHLNISKLKKEILRILKPGGFVFFSEPNLLNPIVFIIKSNRFLKQAVGDSPDEWAVNPLSIKKYFSEFNLIEVSVSEFIPPLSFLPYKFLLGIDKVTSILGRVPLMRYLGGTVQFFMQKK